NILVSNPRCDFVLVDGVPRVRWSRESDVTLRCSSQLTLVGSRTRLVSAYRATSAGADDCGRSRDMRRAQWLTPDAWTRPVGPGARLGRGSRTTPSRRYRNKYPPHPS